MFEVPEYLESAWANCAQCGKSIKGERALRWQVDTYCSLDCIERKKELYRRDPQWYEEFPFERFLGDAPPEKICDYCGGPLPKQGQDRCLRIQDRVPRGEPHLTSLYFCDTHCCGSYDYEEYCKEKGIEPYQ